MKLGSNFGLTLRPFHGRFYHHNERFDLIKIKNKNKISNVEVREEICLRWNFIILVGMIKTFFFYTQPGNFGFVAILIK